MPAATPTEDAVIGATVTEVAAVASPVALAGLVEGQLPRFENEWEGLKANQNATTGQLDFVYVFSDSPEEIEGDATSENYTIYNIVVRYYAVRMNVATWQRGADLVTESIRDALNKNASVFAIGGQRQLRTPEAARVREQGFTTIRDELGGSQMIYRADIVLQVEARRWG